MTGARPVIGISCYVEEVDRGPWTAQRSAVLPYRYVAQVERAGGMAVILPPRTDVDDAMAHAVLSRVDGLVIAGGADVEASRYGAPPHPTSQEPRSDRDAWELALVGAADSLDVPVLGICRGMQVMAVAAGGVLRQHLPDEVGHAEHSPTPGAYARHAVALVPGTRVGEILAGHGRDVPTYHHQGVDAASLAGSPWVPAAWHADGTLEAMERSDRRFAVAVQWHAEEADDAALFEALVTAAGDAAGRGRPR